MHFHRKTKFPIITGLDKHRKWDFNTFLMSMSNVSYEHIKSIYSKSTAHLPKTHFQCSLSQNKYILHICQTDLGNKN